MTDTFSRLDPFQNVVNVQWETSQPTVISVNQNTGSFSNTVAGVVIIAFNPDGTERFRKSAASWYSGAIAIGPDDIVAQIRANRLATQSVTFVGEGVYVCDKDGAALWEDEYNAGADGGGFRASDIKYDGDGNLFLSGRDPGGSTLKKYSPQGAVLWAVSVTSFSSGRLSVDPWGNAALVFGTTLSFYDRNGSQKWIVSVPDSSFDDVACDIHGNVWTSDGETIRKYDHAGVQQLAIPYEPESAGSIDCDSSGHAWVRMESNLGHDSAAHEYDQDGNLGRIVTFPPVLFVDEHSPAVSFEGISAASADISYAGGWHSLIGEPDYRVWWAHRSKKNGTNRWIAGEVATQDSPVPIDFVWPVPETSAMAKRFIGKKVRSPETEP